MTIFTIINIIFSQYYSLYLHILDYLSKRKDIIL